MSGGKRDEDSILPSNGSSSALGDDNRSCEMNLSGKHMREDDANVNEEKLLSSENEGKLQMQAEDSHFLWKTSLCTYFRKPPGGICRHGDACRFAHGESELRLRPDGSWDPTSERAKKIRKTSDGSSVSGVIDEAEDAAIDLTRLDKFLIGLPKKWASNNVKSFLDEQKISYKLAIKKEGMTVGFVSFEDAEQIKSAVEVLKVNSLNCKQIKIADEVCRFQKKKPETETAKHSSNIEDASLCDSGDNAAFGTLSTEDIVSKTKSVRDVVTPLAQMSYSDQLEHKKNSLIQTLKRLTRNARKACPKAVPLPEWVLKSREIGGLPCKLEGILESPQVNGYRNKCEFSVGCSTEGKKIVGFMLGNFRDGVTTVEEPESCPNVSRISCNYAKLFEDFIQSSEFPIWNRIDNTGFWRQFTVREGRCPNQMALNKSLGTEIAEVMLIVQVCSLGHEDESMRSEFNRMTLALKDGAATCSPPLPLTSIVVQDHTGISNVAPADCPIRTLYSSKVDGACDLGVTTITEARIHDYINNLRFSISPTAFFQVNTPAAEKLYSLAGNWAKLSPDTILFDICCGTGTIGLTLAHHVGMVVGIEMNESAVSDANRNAEINCIKNCKFICGKAEVVIGSILEEYLHAPQHYIGSDKSDRNGAHIVGNETNEEICEDLKDAAGASADISATNLRTEAPLGCLEDSCTDNSARFIENSTTECVHTTLQSGGEDVETNASVHQFKNVVAIVDPPRNGLHPTVIKALRTHPRIRRLVYISCNPETLVANAIELCTPTSEMQEKGKGNRGWRHRSNASLARHRVKSMPTSEAFFPVKAVGVDLFPHTHHCEMVMLLER